MEEDPRKAAARRLGSRLAEMRAKLAQIDTTEHDRLMYEYINLLTSVMPVYKGLTRAEVQVKLFELMGMIGGPGTPVRKKFLEYLKAMDNAYFAWRMVQDD